MIRLQLVLVLLLNVGHLHARNLLRPGGWLPGPATVQPKADTPGVQITLPFKDTDRQLNATLPVQENLSSFTSFRLKVSVENPRDLLETSLEFRSGKGGYRATFTLHEAGPKWVHLPKTAFSPFGNPGGWNRIDAVRLNFWPRNPGQTRLRHVQLDARKDAIWIVDSEPSARTPDETYTARVSLRHMDRLLQQLGLPHGNISIDDLGQPEQAKVLIFPYLPRLSDSLRTRLIRASSQGTKLIVFECGDAKLAEHLGVRLGAKVSSNTVGRFNRLRFKSTHWIQPPDHVYQHAWTFHALAPLKDSFVLARWEDAQERDRGEAAAILTTKGAWFNTAWRSGDLEVKSDTMTALIGYLSPWSLLEGTRYHDQVQSPQAFRKRYPNFVPASGPALALSRRAEALHRQASQLRKSRKLAESLRAYRGAYHTLQRAYASSRTEWNAPIRGIWDQQGTGLYVGGWDETCRLLADAGFNAVFAHMATAGRAHFPSRVIPPSKTLEMYGNQLTAFSTAARKHGLQAHAWKICWKLNTRDPAFQQRLEQQGRLMQDAQGNTIPWLSLSDPRNVAHEIKSTLEILRAAPLAGIHLDYMRYPGREADYGPAARKAFEQRIGRNLPQWPKEVLGPMKDEFQRFRQDQVHQAVQQISTAVRKEFPRATLSVAVWGAWPDCSIAQAQDWPRWAREGWVDWLIPMNYTDNPHQFEGWLDLQARQPGVRERLLPGIGLISTNAELNPAQLLDQLHRVRSRQLPGFVLYRLDASMIDRTLPFLQTTLPSAP